MKFNNKEEFDVNVCDEILKRLCAGASMYLKLYDDFNAGYIVASLHMLFNLGFIDVKTECSLSFSMKDDDFIAIIDNIVDTLGSSDFRNDADIYCDWRKGS